MNIQIFVLLVVSIIIPLCVGMLPVGFMNERHRTIGMVYTCGWIIMFAACQILVIPFIVNRVGFSKVEDIYTVIIGSLCILGLGCGVWKRNIRVEFSGRKNFVLWGIVCSLIIIQMFFSYYMQYLDGDDAYYVAMSLNILTDDKMYLTNIHGYSQELDVRHALSPVPVFIAWMSRFTGIHATVLCHSFLGPIFMLLRNVIYVQLGNTLFEKERHKIPLFLLFLNLWYLFGNVSLFTVETFAYTRTWQGKAMLGNIVVPALITWLLFVAKEQMKAGEWCILFLLSAVAAFTTSVGIFLFPIIVTLAGIWIAIYRKNVVVLFEFGVCCIPSFVYGILYLFLKMV